VLPAVGTPAHLDELLESPDESAARAADAVRQRDPGAAASTQAAAGHARPHLALPALQDAHLPAD
jgi:hypothetical protein